MNETMRALYYVKAGDGSITDRPVPECGKDQVLIKIQAASICKNNEMAHNTPGELFFKNPPKGALVSKYPVIPGHEFSGIVEKVGENVKDIEIGDRVSADNALPCGKCYYCQQGLPNYCLNYGSIGLNMDGAFAQYLLVPAEKVVHLPDHISFDEACFLEPTACGIHCMDILDVQYGENVLVYGTGANGIIIAQLLKHSSAANVIAIGSTQKKLAILEEAGVETLLMDRNDYSKHESKIMKRFPLGIDAIVDTTQSLEVVRSFPKLLKKGGRIVSFTLVGKPEDDLPFKATDFMLRELTYKISYCQTGNFGRALEAIASGDVKVKNLISRSYSLEDYFEALDYNLKDHTSLKVVIHPWDSAKNKEERTE